MYQLSVYPSYHHICKKPLVMLLVKKTCMKAYDVGKQIRTDKWTMICFSGVTILLSLTVFSQVLADTMPATSDAIPLLGKNFKTLKMGIQ